ncbi:MAG: pyruvate ferredoxin oxidoreductase [Chloroflexi bacterium]|nr:pyruvate ferredoxin oxidoreductase [Chloroflexota bacterium]
MAVAAVKARGSPRPAEGIAASLSGSLAVAEAMRQTNPDVVAAYPITPSTIMVEKFSEFVANGQVDTEFVAVESEHSAMSACIGAAAAGARAQTVTSSQGLAYMWEALYVASGTRLPIVLHCANRTLSAPINIHCDHSDTMGARDSGWVQLYAENTQEAYDNALMAVRIAEHPEVMLPVLHSQDGYTITHSVERVELLPDDVARQFVGEYRPRYPLLDLKAPVTVGPIVSPTYYFEMKRQAVEAMERAAEVIHNIGQEFGRMSGRYYGLSEEYRLEDAEVALVLLGATVGTARVVVDQLRSQGMRAGLLKVRSFRPFPGDEVVQALAGKAAVAVLDRSLAYGAAGNPLFQDVCSALYVRGMHVPLVNYVYGIGGREAMPNDLLQVFKELYRAADSGQAGPAVRYLALRE